MSEDTVSDENQRVEARRLFASQFGLANHMGLCTLIWVLPPLIARQGKWWWMAGVGVAAILLVAGPSSRFLWRHHDWYRVLSAAAITSALTFTALVLMAVNGRWDLWNMATVVGLLLFAWPAVLKLGSRYDLPPVNRG